MSDKIKNSGKKVHLEFLRILACFLVLVNHTNSSIFLNTEISNLWYISVTYFFISKVAVPLFLMIMGAVLLTKQDTSEKHRTRLVRCVSVIILFTIINYVFKYHDSEMSMQIFFKCLLERVTTSYWYLYLYFGLLLILPILQKISKVLDKKELEYLLFLTLVIGGLVPMLPVFTEFTINKNFSAVLFSPYIGMVFAGYYIEKYVDINKTIAFLSGIIWGGTIILQVLITEASYKVDSSSYLQLDNCIFLTITTSAIAIYIIVKYLFSLFEMPMWLHSIILLGGSLTFGIYLLGDMMIVMLRPMLNPIEPYVGIFIAMIIYEICVFIACALVTIALKKIPYIRSLL